MKLVNLYKFQKDQSIIQRLLDLSEDTDSTVRFQVALTLGEIKPTTSVNAALEKIYINGHKDKWTRKAVLSSLRTKEVLFIKAISQKVPPTYLQELFQLTASRISQPVNLEILIKSVLNTDWKNDEKNRGKYFILL